MQMDTTRRVAIVVPLMRGVSERLNSAEERPYCYEIECLLTGEKKTNRGLPHKFMVHTTWKANTCEIKVSSKGAELYRSEASTNRHKFACSNC